MLFERVLTPVRFISFILIVIGLFYETLGWMVAALVLLVVTFICDGMRHFRRKKERAGSFFDAFADKVLIALVLILFTLRGEFWFGAFIVFLLRDLFVGFIRFIAGRSDIVVNGGVLSRLLQGTQDLVIFLLFVGKVYFLVGKSGSQMSYIFDVALFVVVALGILFAVLSVLQYLLTYAFGVHHKHTQGVHIGKKPLVILANKKSRGFHDGYRRRLLRLFSLRRKAKIVFLPVERKNMFSGIDTEIKGVNHIVIAGGDGSFESALNSRTFHSKSLGFFPLGAGNGYYSYFYKGKRFEYLRSQFEFKEIDLDVLEVEWESGKRQTTFLGIGIDAQVIKESHKRTQHGFLDYAGGSWRTLVGPRVNGDLIVKVDDERYEWENCSSLTLAKIPYLGFGVRALVGNVNVHDGKVYGLACVNTHSAFFNKPLRLWGLFLGIMGVDKSPLVSFKGENIEVRSKKPFALQAGGEFLGDVCWVKVRVVRKQKVLVI